MLNVILLLLDELLGVLEPPQAVSTMPRTRNNKQPAEKVLNKWGLQRAWRGCSGLA
jgi:hypothetical protein